MLHSDFVHLHVHSQYSLLDGACLVSDLINLSLEHKMPALALTDHGNMFGAIEFYTKAMAKGVKPIIGYEAYVAPGSRFEKSSHGIQEASFHLILLAKDEVGYKNILKLVSLGYLEGFYYRPRVDKELLSQYSKGLIALTSCLQGEIPHLLVRDKYEEAKEVALNYRDIFGAGNFYLELQENLIPEQDKANKGVLKLAKELDIPIVATADIHYISKRDARAHEALLCIQTQTTLDDPNHMRFQTDEFYFKSPDEMKQLFAELPQAISSTLEIAEKCNLELEFDKTHLPRFNPPEGKTRDEYLRELVETGVKKRYRIIDETVHNRVEHELKIIKDTGFTSYFLIAWDFIHYAKSKGIPVGPGRGSAAGSVVSYALEITDLDPLKYDLIFERFLNPDRVSLPDIDIDFCYERRGEVINYVIEKYSKDNVAQIITFGTMQPRAVIRDVGRVMGLSYGEVDRIAKLVPPDPNIALEEAINVEPELRNLYKSDPKITQLIETSLALEGLTRHASTHAAGVVISDEPLTNYIPLFKAGEDQISTGYSMSSLEKIGLLKMDFLGLRTLTVIDETVKIIKRTKAIEIDIENIPTEDPKTFALLSRAESLGVFQLESAGMRELLRKLKPNKFEDIIAILALYRPGPIGSGMVDDFIKRKHGLIPIKYDHELLEPILKETYGIIVYQEQVMRIASDLAGFTMSQADSLRRAMSKKTPEVMEQARATFIEGAIKKGIEKRTAEKVFNLMEYFAGYGFNKCVVSSTEIIDADTGRTTTVKELFENRNVKFTLSCNDDLKIVKTKIKDVISNGFKPVYKLKTALGREIVATSNHPFFTFFGWKDLADLRVGERIALPKICPVEGNATLEPYKIITLAGVLSEGNTCHPSGIYYYNNDKLLVEDFAENVKKFNDTIPRIISRRGCFEVYVGTGKDARFPSGGVPWNKGFSKNNYGIALKLMPNKKCGARLWIEELRLDYKKATEKFIPAEIFRLNNEQLALFLGRLWSGDGFIFSKNNTIPFYSTSSHKLCQRVQDLLLRFGIASRLITKRFNYKHKDVNKIKLGYALYLYSYNSISSFIERICPFIIGKDKQIMRLRNYYKQIPPNLETKDTLPSEIKQIVQEEKEKFGITWRALEKKTGISIREFCGGFKSHKKGFRRSTIAHLAQFFESSRLLRFVNSDIVWDRVVSVEYLGIEETYDIEIEGIHNFIANGIVVHNSHSTAYALISYRTAYLKANYPVEFMTALLTSERDNIEKIAFYIEEAQRRGIKILPPDANESFAKFTVIGDAVRFGLSAVKNVGQGAIDSIIIARNRVGKFKSLYELCEHVDTRLVNRKVLESLIKCGAMDGFQLHRSQLIAILDDCLETASVLHKERQNGQLSFFPEFGAHAKIPLRKSEIPKVAEWAETQTLAYEKEMLGFYITGHPLAKYEKLLKNYVTALIKDLGKKRAEEEVILGGIITKAKFTTTKAKGERMAIINLEDLSGQTEVLVFPSAYKTTEKFIMKDAIVCIKGKVNLREERPKLVANNIIPVEELQKKYTQAIIINLTTTGMDEKSLTILKSILESHPGATPVYLNFKMANGKKVEVSVEERLKVEPSDELAVEIERLLGEGTVSFKT